MIEQPNVEDEAEIARIMAMSDNEVLAEGGDPEQASLFVDAAFARAKVVAENWRLRSALERARNVLGNMAMEHEAGWRSIFARWPIHHEPLRSDARHLLPVIDAALALALNEPSHGIEAKALRMGPSASDLANRVCHEEQMTIWSGEVIEALSMGDFLPEDWTYEDIIGANAAVANCVRSIVESAFSHPELAPLPLAGCTNDLLGAGRV